MNSFSLLGDSPPVNSINMIDAKTGKPIMLQAKLTSVKNWQTYEGFPRSNLPLYLSLCQNESVNVLFLPPSYSTIREKLEFELNKYFPEREGLLAFCTSGSSGTPKIVLHKLLSLFRSAKQVIDHYPALRYGITYAGFPSYYMAGVLNNFVVPLLAQSAVVLDSEFDFSTSFRLNRIFERFGVTWSWLSPGIIAAAVNMKHNLRDFSKLELVLNATGPLRSEKRSIASSFFGSEVRNTYGLTELLFVSGEKKMSSQVSLGEPLEGKRLRIESGELQLLTDSECEHIFNFTGSHLEKHNLSKTQDEWIRTNDLGYELDSRIYLTGRSDDVVVIKGENIALSVIEAVAESYPKVISACARIGGAGLEDLIELFVESTSVNQELVRELRQFLLSHLPMTHVPQRIEISRLPRLPSGKVNRQRIRSVKSF